MIFLNSFPVRLHVPAVLGFLFLLSEIHLKITTKALTRPPVVQSRFYQVQALKLMIFTLRRDPQ